MKFTIPIPLQEEHEALHDELRRATQAGGEVGEHRRRAATPARGRRAREAQRHRCVRGPTGRARPYRRGSDVPGCGTGRAACSAAVKPTGRSRGDAMTTIQMQTPAFFDQAPAIVMYDALAQTLGAMQDGLIEYHYLDAVKLAGHSCPTVAGAWLMTRAALARLYPGKVMGGATCWCTACKCAARCASPAWTMARA